MSDEKTLSDGEVFAGIPKYFSAGLAGGVKLPIGPVFGTLILIFTIFCNYRDIANIQYMVQHYLMLNKSMNFFFVW